MSVAVKVQELPTSGCVNILTTTSDLRFSRSLFALVFLVCVFGTCSLFAQSGLRESLERLDKNQDGKISPSEITPLSRPFLERVTKARRMSLNRDNDIASIQEAARIYFALQNGVADSRVRPEAERSIKGFEPDGDTLMVPEFGLGEIRFNYTKDDLDEAEGLLRRYDRDKDGYIDRREAYRVPWTHRNPFEMDVDKDDRLGRLELAQRYARRRLLANDSSELVRKAVRTGNGIRSSAPGTSSSRYQSSTDTYLTTILFSRFDRNRNNSLEKSEAETINLPFELIDLNSDGSLQRDELIKFMKPKQDAASTVQSDVELPDWFYELDTNDDGQLELSEYAVNGDVAEVDRFVSYDSNDDGFLTAQEVAQSRAIVGGVFDNQTAQVLAPKQSIISEIEVDEELMVGDLNVKLSITHTNVMDLDAFLVGPDGQQIELFTSVGGSGNYFVSTIFDDESPTPIIKGRAPFVGSFQPEGLTKRQPSLGHFKGKNAKGLWQLILKANRSERFGMLHGWSLLVQPEGSDVDVVATQQKQDAAKPREEVEEAVNVKRDFGAWSALGAEQKKRELGDFWRNQLEESAQRKRDFLSRMGAGKSPKELEQLTKEFDKSERKRFADLKNSMKKEKSAQGKDSQK